MTPEEMRTQVDTVFESQTSSFRDNVAPVVENWRQLIPHLRTSTLILQLAHPDQVDGFDDLSSEQIQAIIFVISEEIDRRIPRLPL